MAASVPVSPFIRAMDHLAVPATQLGENGAVELTAAGVGEARVALFFALVRDAGDSKIRMMMNKCLQEAECCGEPVAAAAAVADLFILAFQTRHCRGGKGEKDLFDQMILRLYEVFPDTVISLVRLIPRYGCFKDFFRLLNLIAESTKYDGFKAAIIDTVARQLQLDNEKLASVSTSPSLCAKYAPREGSAYVRSTYGKLWFKQLREKLFPGSTDSKTQYRRFISRLTGALDIPEVKMCANTFRDVDFGRVPSLCLNRNRKAFLNEIVDRSKYIVRPQSGKMQVKTVRKGRTARPRFRAGVHELRRPESEDRMLCRQHLIEATRSKALHGKLLHPHSIVTKLMPQVVNRVSSAECDIFGVQWDKIRDNLVSSMDALQKKMAEGVSPAKIPVDFTRLVPLVDVSGSMAGDPMHVAIALGILVSEVNHPSFRNRFISFDTQPAWIDLSNCTNIAEKVCTAAQSPWGGSTDIMKAFELILNVVESAKLPVEEIPDLIIFSDMQFDAADRSAGTHLQQIRQKFTSLGHKLHGKPYEMPRIIFWNLRAVDDGGFPAAACDENVQLLSGFSPSLLEVILTGEASMEEVEDVVGSDGSVVKAAKKVNPYGTLRKVLDNSKYDPVRKVLNASQENQLINYQFLPVEAPGSVAAADACAMEVAMDEGLVNDDWEML
jgi:hypothetical protein